MDKERALEVAVKIAEKRAELRTLEQQFDAALGVKAQLVAVPEEKMSEKAERVLGVFEASPTKTITPIEIAKQLGDVDRKYVQVLVARLEKIGRVERVPGSGRGQYRLRPNLATG
jgi:predicted transcriptional regulator of viral defense system